jgi:hypothetical protein
MSTRLTSTNSRSEDIGIIAVIVAELKFRDIQRQILAAYLVITAHDAALNQRPKALNRIGMNCANDVLTSLMVHSAMRIFAAKMVVDLVSVGAKQADFFGNGLSHEFVDCRAVDTQYNARNDVALSLDCTDDGSFERILATSARSAALIPMAILIFGADIGFVHFNDTAELLDVLDKRGSDFVAHEPRGFVGTEAHVAHDLQRTHALFGSQHKMRDCHA